jgi:S-adenosylmethionine:tRNA ribosyltransferase-isomerase
VMAAVLDFELPPDLEASAPPEEQGTLRDRVRLMVGHRSTGDIVDDVFASLPAYLQSGDALVINTSATIPAAMSATTADGEEVVVHLSTRLGEGLWTVEVRRPAGFGSLPGPDLQPQALTLPAGGEVRLLTHPDYSKRMWFAELRVPGELFAYLDSHGRPIRYRYAAAPWHLDAYQTVYAREPGSAEMPSAGRPFTTELMASLVASGIVILPIVLHAGVASLELGEHPAPEQRRVPIATASAINALRAEGGRVIAVGTTVTRALESAADLDGTVRPAEGLTDVLIGPNRPTRVVDGLITGWHEPKASHLELIEAVAGPSLATRMYERALATGYLWHEFGDSCLILP